MKRRIIKPLLPALFLSILSPVLTVTAGGDLRGEAEIAIRNFQSADSKRQLVALFEPA